MGPGIAARPHCAERRICRCSRPWLTGPKAHQPVLDPGAPAQASLSIMAVRRPGSLFGSAPERASPPNSPPLRPEGFSDLDVPRPFLGWVPFTRPVSLGGKPPSQKRAPALPAPLADWSGNPFAASSPRRTVRLRTSFHRLPAEIGPSVTLRVLLAVAGLPGRWGLPSRSRIERAQGFRVAPSGKCSLEPVDNGDIAHNSRVAGRDFTHHGESPRQIAVPRPGVTSREDFTRLPFRSLPPTSPLCPNPPSPPPSQPTWPV